MRTRRSLDWPRCYNVRDLGGLPTVDGWSTRWGAVVRGDSPERLTAEGWSALAEHGVRTIVDLQEPGEGEPDAAPRPPGLTTVRLPLDDTADTDFWQRWTGLDCTPLYYGAFLERFGQRTREVLAAVAHAEPGGVLVHCGSGRDRTGLVCLLLLAAAGVPAHQVADDYVLSAERLAPAHADLGLGDQNGKIDARIAEHGTTAHAAVVDTVTALDLDRLALGDALLAATRNRLLASG